MSSVVRRAPVRPSGPPVTPSSTRPVMRKWSVILAVTAAVLALSAGAWRTVQSGELQVAPLMVGVLMIALAFLFAHNAPGAHHS